MRRDTPSGWCTPSHCREQKIIADFLCVVKVGPRHTSPHNHRSPGGAHSGQNLPVNRQSPKAPCDSPGVEANHRPIALCPKTAKNCFLGTRVSSWRRVGRLELRAFGLIVPQAHSHGWGRGRGGRKVGVLSRPGPSLHRRLLAIF